MFTVVQWKVEGTKREALSVTQNCTCVYFWYKGYTSLCKLRTGTHWWFERKPSLYRNNTLNTRLLSYAVVVWICGYMCGLKYRRRRGRSSGYILWYMNIRLCILKVAIYFVTVQMQSVAMETTCTCRHTICPTAKTLYPCSYRLTHTT